MKSQYRFSGILTLVIAIVTVFFSFAVLAEKTIISHSGFEDFNRDGFLDIGVNAYENGTKAYIIWGSSDGYSLDNKTLVTNKNSANPWRVTSADLNRDGFLGLVYASGDNPVKFSEIVWGTGQSYENESSTFLYTNRMESPAIADLDDNGWLDLIFPGGVNIDNLDYHSPSLIYWAAKQGIPTRREASWKLMHRSK